MLCGTLTAEDNELGLTSPNLQPLSVITFLGHSDSQ